ncbi:MAG: efflux RND transporter permease subunit, partial [Planctomycetota bacterium]|nr:efflux RND transporter permease subunit [Planctomycetota bacterium]
LRQVARIALGPAERRGALDDAGVEAVGGVVVARFGENPRAVLERLRATVEAIGPSLPSRVLPDGRTSRVEIVPFYDRGTLIEETLETLEHALGLEILITMLVLTFLVAHLRGALIVAGALPLTVLTTFLAMRAWGVESHLMSLAGIAIAIGTMVDMGIVVVENILRRLREARPGVPTGTTVREGVREIAGAVTTSAATTVVSFLPIFTMTAAEGKLFRPLAFTKTFALIAAWFIALTVLPAVAAWLLPEARARAFRLALGFAAAVGAGASFANGLWVAGAALAVAAAAAWTAHLIRALSERFGPRLFHGALGLAVLALLARFWAPLGPGRPLANGVLVFLWVAVVLIAFRAFGRAFEPLLRAALSRKGWFLAVPAAGMLMGLCIWLGAPRVFGFLPAVAERVGMERATITGLAPWRWAAHRFPGLGREFMPPLEEGSFLYMPTTMPHASIGETLDQLAQIDRAIATIPEVDRVVGKLGRAESALDPAPISMFETLVTLKPEFVKDETTGRPVRAWRDEMTGPRDVWDEIVRRAEIPGVTSAPYLQPIAARTVMLQSGMRAPMGLKVTGPDLDTLERAALRLEAALKTVPGVRAETVLADRVAGKPYLEIEIDRTAIARWGVSVRDVQNVIEVAIGGKTVTTTVEGRERYAVRVRYPRERRGSLEAIGNVLVATPGGAQVPLKQLSTMNYTRGPQVIRGENAFSVAYVTFDRDAGVAESEAVERAQRFLSSAREEGTLSLPAGVAYDFEGTYKNQIRSERTLLL